MSVSSASHSHATLTISSHPLALACIGDRSAETSVLDLVRVLVERGNSDISIQDEIGDDCLHHTRTLPLISSYLRAQGHLSWRSQKSRCQNELSWAVYSCAPTSEIKALLERGADPRGLTTGFRSETGNILHCAVASLNHIQGSWLPISTTELESRKVDNIALILQSGADVHVLDDQDATPFDYVLEVVRKFRHRRTLHLWRAALKACDIDWELFLQKEKDIHANRRLEDYPCARNYYWSLQQQKDFWLSDKWVDESEERFFWNSSTMDYLPPGAAPGRYKREVSEVLVASEFASAITCPVTYWPSFVCFHVSGVLWQIILFLSYVV